MSSKQSTCDELIAMGFQKNYIHRAFKIYENNYGHNHNTEVITEIICGLQNKDNDKKTRKLTPLMCSISHKINDIAPPNKKRKISNATDFKTDDEHNNNINIPPFLSHMTLEEANKLQIHDKVDHRDQVGKFVYATVKEKQGTNLKIHYDGWSRKWDTCSDYSS
eukprot:518894_1